MKYFEMFAGVGGFSQGLDEKRFEPIGFSEVDKFSVSVLKYHYPNTTNYGDCTKIDWRSVPDFDLLTGGSPCQDFSIAGKRAGIVGSRSGLVWEYIRCLTEKQPRYFIWENVKGVMSSRGGWDFANILIAFSEAGYSLWWQVLNAKDFGVPQNRERIFVVGVRDGSPREVFFEREDAKNGDERNQTEQRWAVTLTGRSAGGGNARGNYIKQLNLPTHSNDRVYGAEGLAPALNTMQGGNRQPFIVAGSGRIRKLLPIECERLMSWTDDWTRWGIDEKGERIEMSDSQRYKMCGNGVVSNVVRVIWSVL
jgi:DNA (cytosine-5)-methyltransferase 1